MQEESKRATENRSSSLIGQTHHGCTFLKVISHGGLSTVYEVLYAGGSSSKKIRAAKVYFLESQESKRGRHFRKQLEQHIHTEIEIISQFKNFSLPKLYKCFSLSRTENGRKVVELTVLVMRLYKAPNLDMFINHPDTNLTSDVVLNVLKSLLTTVKQLHSSNILHRDIKPENIIVETDAAGIPRPVLIDFGISVRMGKDDFLLECDAGTPEFKAPEISAKQRGSYASDIYAIGVTAIKLRDRLKAQFASRKSHRDSHFISNTLRDFISKATTEHAHERASLEELAALLACHSSSLQ